MMRFILLILLVSAVLIAITAMLGTIKAFATITNTEPKDNMPVTFQKIAYVVLIVLMLGVSAGWLGPA